VCGTVLQDADLVVCIGTRMGTAAMADLQAFIGDTPSIVVGFDDTADARYQGDDRTVADPKQFLTALLERLGNEHRAGDDARLGRIAAMKATIADGLAAHNAPHRGATPIHPGAVMEAMNAVLDDDAVVASDVGNCQMWARLYRRIATPWSFMQSGVWNAMSFALPTALVAGMEMPDRDVVALAGDGAFLMTSGDLPTAAEYGANILMVIMNNGAFGQTFAQQQNIYGHTFGTTFSSPDFAAMARSCGAAGIRVSDPKQLADALRDGLAATRERPALVEIMIADSPFPSLHSVAAAASGR